MHNGLYDYFRAKARVRSVCKKRQIKKEPRLFTLALLLKDSTLTTYTRKMRSLEKLSIHKE